MSLPDMQPDEITGEYQEHTLTYHDQSSRRIFVTEIETPYPDGHLIVSRTNPEGYITHLNDSFVEMSGYSRQELINAPHYILRHPDMPAAAFQDLWQTVTSGQKWNGYVKNLRKDGGFYWVYATVIPNIRKNSVVSYTSVRRKPARKKIEHYASLYKTMLSSEHSA